MFTHICSSLGDKFRFKKFEKIVDIVRLMRKVLHCMQHFSYIVEMSSIAVEISVLGKYHRHVTDKLYQIMLNLVGFELTTLVVIGTDCIGSYKSSYHAITTTLY
jgi:hypothetical protein